MKKLSRLDFITLECGKVFTVIGKNHFKKTVNGIVIKDSAKYLLDALKYTRVYTNTSDNLVIVIKESTK